MGTAMEKYLYFRTVADEDDDDAVADVIALPARQIVAMAPSADGTVTIWFESLYNHQTDGANEVVIKDSAVINVTTHRHKKVMQAIVRSINGGPHNDGLIVVADDSTVEFGGAAGSKNAVYLDSDIATMGAITIATANS